MLKDKRKLKKLQKITGWVLFISMMGFLLMAAALCWLDEDGMLSNVAGILFFLLLLVAILDMAVIFCAQVYLDIREKGWKGTVFEWIKIAVVCLGIGIVIVVGYAIWKRTGFHAGMMKDVLRFLAVAWCGSYGGAFWSRKLPEE